MSDNTTVNNTLYNTPDTAGRVTRADYFVFFLSLGLGLVGFYLAKRAEVSGSFDSALIGLIFALVFLVVGVGYFIFRSIKIHQANVKNRPCSAQESVNRENRAARGEVDLFEDWEVRGVWREWSADIERSLHTTLGNTAEDDFERVVLNAKQYALAKLAVLAKKNPAVSLQEWHDHLSRASVITGHKTDTSGETHEVKYQASPGLSAVTNELRNYIAM